MRRQVRRIAAVAVLMIFDAAAQSLAPEILLLSRIKNHLRDEIAHIPNYTCLETISRFHQESKSGIQIHKGMVQLDTVRLEIVYSDHREWYGEPGAQDLSADRPMGFVTEGMIGDGAFAISLHNLISGAIFTYRGEEMLDGRRTVKYDFRIPSMLQPLTIAMNGSVSVAGEEGSIWADPESYDLIRMQSRAAELPSSLPVRELGTTVTYAPTRIGDSVTLLAQRADSSLFENSGTASYNVMEFTHCRSYAASSAIRFEAPTSNAHEAAATRATLADAIPANLEVTVVLAAPVSEDEPVGTVIEGKTSGIVLFKGKAVVPDGTPVRGRIRRLERLADGAFSIGLEFTEVETQAGSIPFYADLVRIDKDPHVESALTRRITVPRGGEEVQLPELPGIASFLVKGANPTLSPGFRMVWRTRGQIR